MAAGLLMATPCTYLCVGKGEQGAVGNRCIILFLIGKGADPAIGARGGQLHMCNMNMHHVCEGVCARERVRAGGGNTPADAED